MNDLVALADAGWWNLLWVLIAFGFAPGLALQLMVRIYPTGHPRRDELLAEYAAIEKRRERPMWVAENLFTVLFDGLPERRRATRERRAINHVGTPGTSATIRQQHHYIKFNMVSGRCAPGDTLTTAIDGIPTHLLIKRVERTRTGHDEIVAVRLTIKD